MLLLYIDRNAHISSGNLGICEGCLGSNTQNSCWACPNVAKRGIPLNLDWGRGESNYNPKTPIMDHSRSNVYESHDLCTSHTSLVDFEKG